MELSVAPVIFCPLQVKANGDGASTSCQVTETHFPSPPLLPADEGKLRRLCRTEEAGPSPFPGLPVGVPEMRVKEGSKIRNLMGFAMARMQGEAGEAGGLRQVVFAGSGRAVTKTITCVEIMKRKVGGLHQLTKLRYKVVREVWAKSDEGRAKAPEVTVSRTVPSISILLSKDPLDPREPGYQPPQALSQEEEVSRDPPSNTNKRTKGLPPPPDQPGPKRPSWDCVD